MAESPGYLKWSRLGVSLGVDIHEAMDVNMCINLCRAETCVAKHFLYDTQVCAS